MRNTTVLVAVHGSGMSNIVFLPKDAVVIEIFPYGFERITYEILARKIGKYCFIYFLEKKALAT